MDKLFSLLWIPVLLSLTACSTVNDWLSDETYETPPEKLVAITPEFEPQIVWSKDTGDGTGDDYTNLSSWIQGTAIFSIDHTGKLTALDLQSGQLRWDMDLDTHIEAGVGGGDGIILVGTAKGELIAIDEKKGGVLWRAQLSSEILAPAKAAQGVAVARSADGKIAAFSVKDGSVLWTYQRTVPLLSLRGVSEPVIAGNKVIAGFANGKLVALSLREGAVLWEANVAVPRGRTELDRLVDIDSAPVVRDDVVYIVAYHGQLAAFDLDSGQRLWARDMSSRAGLDVVPGEAVYVTDDSSNVWALQDGTGDALWRQTRLLRRKVTAPVIIGDMLFVGDFEGYLHGLAREDGRFVARKKISDAAIRSQPLVQNNTLYVTAADGTVTALRMTP